MDEIHITGSDRTYDAIVFGTGEEGRRRKERDEPRLAKRFTAELGNVSPVIVVPGPRAPGATADIAYHAENLVTMLVNNAGFNCNATRVVIQHASSPERQRLLAAVRDRPPPHPAAQGLVHRRRRPLRRLPGGAPRGRALRRPAGATSSPGP